MLVGTALTLIRQCDASARAKISGWVSDQNRDHTVPTISSDLLKRISAYSVPSVTERANRLLLEAIRGQNTLTDQFHISHPKFIAATYSREESEVDYFVNMLMEEGLLKRVSADGTYQVLPRGHIAADELTRRTTRSDKGFVAMWFNKDLQAAYEKGFQVAVLNAGYNPVRVDRIEHVNRIDDEIMSQIKTARFVVADFTGHRGGVYFEAGFALGLDVPVIWTCRKDDIKNLHFDIRQYNTIDWETHEELSLRLQHRIEATVGKGPKAILDS